MKLELNNNIDISPAIYLITNINQYFKISEKHGIYIYNNEMLTKLVELAEYLNKFFKVIEDEIQS